MVTQSNKVLLIGSGRRAESHCLSLQSLGFTVRQLSARFFLQVSRIELSELLGFESLKFIVVCAHWDFNGKVGVRCRDLYPQTRIFIEKPGALRVAPESLPEVEILYNRRTYRTCQALLSAIRSGDTVKCAMVFFSDDWNEKVARFSLCTRYEALYIFLPHVLDFLFACTGPPVTESVKTAKLSGQYADSLSYSTASTKVKLHFDKASTKFTHMVFTLHSGLRFDFCGFEKLIISGGSREESITSPPSESTTDSLWEYVLKRPVGTVLPVAQQETCYLGLVEAMQDFI